MAAAGQPYDSWERTPRQRSEAAPAGSDVPGQSIGAPPVASSTLPNVSCWAQAVRGGTPVRNRGCRATVTGEQPFGDATAARAAGRRRRALTRKPGGSGRHRPPRARNPERTLYMTASDVTSGNQAGPGAATAPTYPFAAIVGMPDLKLALLLNAVSPAIGGGRVRGEKGTAKSTVVSGLGALLPPIP